MLKQKPRRTRTEECLSDLQLDRWRVDEIEERMRGRFEAHLRVCGRCRERLDALVADATAFASDAPPWLEPVDPSRPVRRRFPLVAGLGSVAAAAAVLVIVLVGDTAPEAAIDHEEEQALGARPEATERDQDGVRTKGGPRLGFVVRRRHRTFDGSPGETLHPDDALQFHYVVSEPAHLAVLSVDGADLVSVYHPEGATTAPVRPAREQSLDGSVVLDATLGTETIFGVFCDRPRPLEELTRALEDDRDMPRFPAGCVYDRLDVEKRSEDR